MNKSSSVMCIAVLLSLNAGCTTSTDPLRVERDYGNSVRSMINAQIYNPNTVRNPPATPPLGLDGPKGEGVLDVYRGDVGKPKEVEKPIFIQIGQ